jgi:quinol-cytochrome oxidoreductase complex cytochrome b subunit
MVEQAAPLEQATPLRPEHHGALVSLDEPAEESNVRFFPEFALLEAVTAFGLLVLLLLLAILTEPHLEEVANPEASGYVPRPEWYFLWMFELLKYFKGALEPIGTFAIPTLGILALLALPFMDRRPAHLRPLLPNSRPIRLWPRMLGGVMVLALGGLTVIAATAPHPEPSEPVLTPIQAAGQATFDKMGCMSCHAVAGQGGTRGPDLTQFGILPDAERRALLHFTGVVMEPDSVMPGYQLTPHEVRALVEYLMTLN